MAKRLDAATTALVTASSAAAGGVVSSLTLYPLETLKSRMAAGNMTVSQIIKEVGGIIGLYKGSNTKAVQVFFAKFIFFYCYSFLEKALLNGKRMFTVRENMAVGYISDLAIIPVTLPIECVVTQLQHQSKEGNTTVVNVVRKIFKEKGIAGFFVGVKWQFLVSMLSAIQQTVYDQLKARILSDPKQSLSAGSALTLGGASRLVALIFVFPFMRMKTLHQLESKTGTKSNFDLPTLYSGFAPEALRGILSSALLFMIKEKLHSVILNMILTFRAK